MTEEKKVETPVEETKEAPKTEEAPKVEKKDPASPEATQDKDVKPADAKDSGEVKVPAKFKKLVEEIESMSVLELNELVKLLEKKFGVSASAVAVAGPANGGGDAGEEKTDFTVELKSFGESKIGVIKAVKAALGLGLAEAKDLVEGVPSKLKDGIKKEEAEELKKLIEEAGGSVELK